MNTNNAGKSKQRAFENIYSVFTWQLALELKYFLQNKRRQAPFLMV